MADSAGVASETADVDSHQLKLAIAAFITGAVSFFMGSLPASQTGTPPSSTPVLWISSHTLWFGGVAFLAIGAVALVRGVDSLKTGLAGYLAIGALGLGVLTGLQWTVVTYIDVQAARNAPTDEYELIREALISPIGSGHALIYGMLVGSGVAFLGWGLRRTQITHRFVGWAGVAIGTVAFLGLGTTLLTASAPGDIWFAIIIFLSMPFPYLWAIGVAINIYRRQALSR